MFNPFNPPPPLSSTDFGSPCFRAVMCQYALGVTWAGKRNTVGTRHPKPAGRPVHAMPKFHGQGRVNFPRARAVRANFVKPGLAQLGRTPARVSLSWQAVRAISHGCREFSQVGATILRGLDSPPHGCYLTTRFFSSPDSCFPFRVDLLCWVTHVKTRIGREENI